MELLVLHGANVNYETQEGRTALIEAVSQNPIHTHAHTRTNKHIYTCTRTCAETKHATAPVMAYHVTAHLLLTPVGAHKWPEGLRAGVDAHPKWRPREVLCTA